MLFETLRPSRSLTVDRFSSFDEFEPTELIGSARSIPLNPRQFSLGRAILRLKRCQIILQHSFERILETGYQTAGAFFIVPMSEDIDATMNGVALDRSSVVLVRGRVVCQTVERRANVYAVINTVGPLAEYDWFDKTDTVSFLKAREELARLQATIRTVFALVSGRADIVSVPGHVTALELAVLSTLDRLVATSTLEGAGGPRAQPRYLQIVRRVDDIVENDPAAAVYTDEIAKECGVSIRTLHNAFTAIRGHSLHRYLALKRLASVRQQLALGGSGARVGRIARDNGFFHAGEFSALYRRHFGETPAATLRGSGARLSA